MRLRNFLKIYCRRDVVLHAVVNDYDDRCWLTEVENGRLILEHIARNNTLAVLSGNEIGTGIENRFLGKKDRKLQINETKAKA